MRMPKGTFVPGRHAMTCCADDIQFIGYLCHTNHAKSSTIKSLKNKMWVTLTAEVKVEYKETEWWLGRYDKDRMRFQKKEQDNH